MAHEETDGARKTFGHEDITLAYQSLCLKLVSTALTLIYGIRAVKAYGSGQVQDAAIFLGLGILAFLLLFIPKSTRDYKFLGVISGIFFSGFEAFFIFQEGKHFFLFLFLLPLVCLYTSLMSGMLFGLLAGAVTMLELVMLRAFSPALVEGSFAISLNQLYLYLLAAELLVVLTLFAFQYTLNKGNDEIKTWRLLRAKKARSAALAEGLGKLAHEVNNPLAILHSAFIRYRGLHDQGRGAEPYSQQLPSYMQDSADRILKVLDNLRTFAEGGLLEPVQVLDPQNLFEQLKQMSYERIRSAGARLNIAPFTQQQVLYGRPKQVLFILSALLDNALDATVEEPKIVTLRFILDEASFCFEVEDNGLGITDDISERIFQPFVSTKPFGQSMGMNLSICHGISSDLNGQMGFKRKARGTLFWLKLPRMPNPDGPP